jgi:hypothetical protein
VNISLITLDGVLRKLLGSSPIPEGIRLYQSLASTGGVVLSAHEHEHDQVEEWLEIMGCVRHDFVTWNSGGPAVDTANHLRRQGYDIDIVVDPDPGAVIHLIEAGFNTLLFTHSQYAHPSWRPDADTGVKPWGEIVEFTAKVAKMKAADARLRQD